MSYIKIEKIKKENIDTPEKGYIYFGYDDSSVEGSENGFWIKDDDGTPARYVLGQFESIPSITSFYPQSSAYNGDIISIYGSNFVPGNTTVTFNGVAGTDIIVMSPIHLTVTVPLLSQTSTAANVVISTAYGESSPSVYTIHYKQTGPIITSILPVEQSIGSDITINGYNFVVGSTIVWFSNGVSGVTNTINSSTLVTTVPNIQTGSTIVWVETNNVQSNVFSVNVNDDPNPNITSFYPSYGFIGDTIHISGTNFATGQVQVRFGNTPATNITVYSSTYLTADISTETSFGPTSIKVGFYFKDGFTVSGNTFGLLPTITSILPTGSTVGDVVTVVGTNLHNVSNVTFSGIVAIIQSGQTSTSMNIMIGSNTYVGENTVIFKNQYGSSTPFIYNIPGSILGPIITGFTPSSQYKNRSIYVDGNNFGTSGNSIYFGNIPALVGSQTNIKVAAQISVLSPTGLVDVRITNTIGSYVKSGFIINVSGSTAPVIDSVSPVYAKLGDTIDIYGSNLSGANISFGTSFSGSSALVITVDSTHIKAIVPSDLVNYGESLFVNIYASNIVGSCEYKPFEVYSEPISQPNILDFTSTVCEGSLITINGSNFVKYFTDASIYVNGSYFILESLKFISNTQITGYIPNTGYIGSTFVKVVTQAGSSQKTGLNIINCVSLTTTTTTGVPSPVTTTTTTINGTPPSSTTTTTNNPTTTTTSSSSTTTSTTIPPTTTTTTTLCYNPIGYNRTFYYNIQENPGDPLVNFSGSELDACTAKSNLGLGYSLVSPSYNAYSNTNHSYYYNGCTINTSSCAIIDGYFIFSGNYSPTIGGTTQYYSNSVIHVSNNIIVSIINCV